MKLIPEHAESLKPTLEQIREACDKVWKDLPSHHERRVKIWIYGLENYKLFHELIRKEMIKEFDRSHLDEKE